MPDATDKDLHIAYVEMALQRLELGFTPYMLTLMFNPLSGNKQTMHDQMMREATWLYGQLLTRLHRNPAKMDLMDLPLWLVFPDRPVPKTVKQPLKDVSINDGAHLHAAVMIPPQTRLPIPFNLYLVQHQDRFACPGRALFRIHIQTIYETPEVAFAYISKALERGTATGDDVLVLPKTHAEMQYQDGRAQMRTCSPNTAKKRR